MAPALNEIVDGFATNVRGVAKLIDFDRDLLEFAADELRSLQSTAGLASSPGLARQIKRTEEIIRGVRDNDSLKARFQLIFNQAVVLLVSYFGSAVEDIFKLGVASALAKGECRALLEAELKLSFAEIRDQDWNLREAAPDILVEKKDLSFQDMQAVSRAFRDYLNVEIPRDKTVNNIVLAQACRHVIVHSAAVTNPRLLRQVRKATPRDLKLELANGERVDFTPHEISLVSGSMEAYVLRIAKLLAE